MSEHIVSKTIYFLIFGALLVLALLLLESCAAFPLLEPWDAPPAHPAALTSATAEAATASLHDQVMWSSPGHLVPLA